MRLQDFIAGGFYINLDARDDKREAFEAELARVGLSGLVQRLPAITPRQLGYTPTAGGVYAASAYSKACAASHALAIKHAAARQWRNVLIFEDDAAFYTDGGYDPIAVIEQALDALTRMPWDVFYLGVDPGKRYDTFDEIAPHVIALREAICAHAYIVNSAVFPEILAAAQSETYIDCHLSSYPRKYAAYPLCVMQRSDGYINDIGPNFYGGLGVHYWLDRYAKKINKLY